MAYTNTVDVLGEQETFDALVEDRLTELTEDRIKEPRAYCFYFKKSLLSVNLPSLTTISERMFGFCTNLHTIDVGENSNQLKIMTASFSGCENLHSLIIRTNSMATLSSSSNLELSPFICYRAGIYVKPNLLEAYKANTDYFKVRHMIRSIDEIPVSDFSSINMSWSEIKASIDDESFFSSNYSLGDVKSFTYTSNNNTYKVYAEIAMIDNVNKCVDFITKISCEIVKMNDTKDMVSYSNSQIKMRLDDIYNNELQSDLKSVISPVTKKYYSYDGTIESVPAYLWLLNTKDVAATGNYLKENEGNNYFTYPSIYVLNYRRIMFKYPECISNTGIQWYLGSAYNSSRFVIISNGGGTTNGVPTSEAALIFGFRIKKES